MMAPTYGSLDDMPAVDCKRLLAAHHLHATARLCLVVGSSLVVYPAASLPEVSLDAGGKLAIVNQTETHLDAQAALVARERAGVLLGKVQAR